MAPVRRHPDGGRGGPRPRHRPGIAVRDDGRVVLSLVNHNHAGVTVADLALADRIDRAIEQGG